MEVVSILLSTEAGGGSSDRDTMQIATENGYTLAGLDSTANRTNPRAGLGYFRGAPAVPWPVSDRRRLVIVNTLAGSPSHQQNEILVNQEIPSTSVAIAAIDAVQAAPAGTTFAAWQSMHAFPADQDGPDDDPDRDGSVNLLEFHAGTDPANGSSRPTARIERTPTGFHYTYQRAVDRLGITHALQAGPLDAFSPFTPTEETSSAISPNVEEVTVTLPATFGPFLRQAVTLAP